MASELLVNKITPESGTTLTLGESGDTITIPSGATLTNNGTQTGLTLSDNLLFNASGKGVYLGVTSATASNLLDDYEEGTWTPVYQSSGTNPTFTPNLQEGKYTKVGRMVFASFRLRGAITGTKVGNLQIGGLPFTASSSQATGGGPIRFTEDFGANAFPSGLGVEPSATHINLTTHDSDSARGQKFTAVSVSSTSASATGNYIIGHIVYDAS